MSAKRNRKRASKTRRRQALLSLRAERVLLFDGDPVPPVYLTYKAEHIRNLIDSIKHYGTVPAWMKFDANPYQAQLEKAAMELQKDINEQVIKDCLKLDT